MHLPVAFDTGSAGLTLYAPGVFPPDIVSASGFVFPAGQDTLTYNGITVTSQVASRAYGGSNGRTQTGNIGYATITFGDGAGALTTTTMPVLFYYAITETATGAAVEPGLQQGWFGVDAGPGTITVPGSVAPAAGYPVCTPDTTGTCRVTSVLKYLSYGTGIDAGFALSPVTLQACDLSSSGSCLPAAALTVGLDSHTLSGYTPLNLTCPPPGYTGPDTIQGFAVCAAYTPGTTITASAPDAGSVTTGVLFDTGTPWFTINLPAGSAFPGAIDAGTAVDIALPGGYRYDYTAGTGLYQVIVATDTTPYSVAGLAYFTGHAFYIDYAAGTLGWR